MSETSQATPPAGTDATTVPPTGTEPTTSSTTTETSSTTQSEGDEPSLLNQKPKEGEAPKEGEKPKEPAKAEGPPEKYEDFKVPDGYELDKGVTESATALFKKHGLSQTAAQELVDFYSKHAIESSQVALQAVKDMRAGWVKTAQALPEIGTELGAGGKVITAVGRMLDQIGDTKLANDFRQAMDLTGAGDHPAFIQVMYRLAQKLGEGTAVRGNGPSRFGTEQPGQGAPSAAKAIYPNLP